MDQLTQTVADLVASEKKLEARVTAHEAAQAETVAKIQVSLDALKASIPDVAGATATLTALKASIDAFDPDTSPAATPAVP